MGRIPNSDGGRPNGTVLASRPIRSGQRPYTQSGWRTHDAFENATSPESITP